MGRIILHIGTHKTGTTSIQRFADQNRVQLAHRGLHYPCYSSVGLDPHYAHLDVPKAIMGTKTRLGPQALEQFLNHVRECSSDFPATLISAEPFWRGMIDGKVNSDADTYWPARSTFIERVASALPLDQVEIAIVLRGQADFIESLFQEDVKVNRWRQNLRAFARHRAHLLDYERQVQAWASVFPTIRLINFESLREQADLVRGFFAELGIDTSGMPEPHIHNGAIQADFVTALRLLNRSDLGDREFRGAKRRLLAHQDDPKAKRWPTRSLWHSAQARVEFDALYHDGNDRLIAAFEPDLQPIRSRPHPTSIKYGERPSEAALTLLLERFCGLAPVDAPQITSS